MGNGNPDVGNEPPTGKPGQPKVETLAGNKPLKTERPKICGAMLQQRGDSGRGNEYVPQKFLQLVGCSDRKSATEPWIRPRPPR